MIALPDEIQRYTEACFETRIANHHAVLTGRGERLPMPRLADFVRPSRNESQTRSGRTTMVFTTMTMRGN